MAVSVIETIKSRANAGNTAYIVVVKLLCDNYSDLPTQSGLSGYELAQGCIAHVINENKDYMIDSSGNWHVYGGDSWTNVYTKSETDALLDDKQDELTTAQLDAVNSGITAAKVQQYDDTVTDEAEDRAALVELVDAGAKNKYNPAVTWDSITVHGVTVTRNGDTFSIASGTTKSGNNNFINIDYQANTNVIPAGDWVLSFDTNQQNVRFQACWNSTLQANSSFGNNCFFTVPENTTDSWFRIILRGNTNMAGTSFKIMLCPRILWDISQKFVPYRPSMAEMYQMILALQ